MFFRTTTQKQIEAAAVLLACEDGKMDRLRLLKLLYIAERESFAERGAPIIGGRLAALDNGPLHSETYDLIKGSHGDSEEWRRFFSNQGHVVCLIADPGHMELSPFEIDKLTEVSQRMLVLDSWGVADLTHKFDEWIKSHVDGSSKTIPTELVLESLGFTANEIALIKRDAEDQRLAASMLVLDGN